MRNADSRRLREMVEALAGISEPCEAGVQRQSYTKEYHDGVRYVKREMEQLGLRTWEDPVGNLFGKLEGQDPGLPALLSGSHLDTVRCAGAFDGIAGVVCALEAARMILESGRPLRHPYAVFGTIGEEGTRFGQVLLGSQFMTGILGEKELDTLRGIKDGKTLRQAIHEYGLSGDVRQAVLAKESVQAVLEIHGEQGPVLEKEAMDIGIVNAIAGIVWLEVEIIGETNHSGTVPMDQRRDAGIGAYTMILRLNQYITEHYTGKATMTAGQMELYPGSSNCIPGRCRFTLDIRSGSSKVLDEILQRVISEQQNILRTLGLVVTIHIMSKREPTPMDKGLQSQIEKSCCRLGYRFRFLDSGAGHDAMVFAGCWPTAMIFLPNRNGVSHNPAEWIDYDYMKKGTEVLYQTIRCLDEQ